VEWVVACDQSFEEVERPEFHRLLEYTHMGSKPLDIPHRNSLKNRRILLRESKRWSRYGCNPIIAAIPNPHVLGT